MTITHLLRRQPTESQYEMLQRAERVFDGHGRRHYGGQLTPEEVRQLTDRVELRTEQREAVELFCVQCPSVV